MSNESNDDKAKPVHLRLYMLESGWEKYGHPVSAVLAHGISYQHATPQSIGDQWWFWNCEHVPDQLPKYLSVADLHPMACIGYGLSEEQAHQIRDYIPSKDTTPTDDDYGWFPIDTAPIGGQQQLVQTGPYGRFFAYSHPTDGTWRDADWNEVHPTKWFKFPRGMERCRSDKLFPPVTITGYPMKAEPCEAEAAAPIDIRAALWAQKSPEMQAAWDKEDANFINRVNDAIEVGVEGILSTDEIVEMIGNQLSDWEGEQLARVARDILDCDIEYVCDGVFKRIKDEED